MPSLLQKRIKMAQGGLALAEKSLTEALTLATEYDKLYREADDKGQGHIDPYDEYVSLNEEL